jgi:hypothetical protein
VAVALAVLPVVVAVERTNPIGRSFSLFHGAVGPALARILTIGGLYLVPALIIAAITAAVTAATGALPAGAPAGTPRLAPLGVEITMVAVQYAVLAVLAVVLVPLWVLTYTDLRARKEPTTSDMIRADIGLA